MYIYIYLLGIYFKFKRLQMTCQQTLKLHLLTIEIILSFFSFILENYLFFDNFIIYSESYFFLPPLSFLILLPFSVETLLIPKRPLPLPLIYLLFICEALNLIWIPYMSEWEVIYWSVDSISVATPLKKQASISPGNH